MKRLLQLGIFLAIGMGCAVPSHAAITVTAAGTNGTAGSNVTSLTAPSSGTYSQPAHDCIVVIGNDFGSSTLDAPNVPTDVGLDTFTQVIAPYSGGNNDQIDVYIAYNVAASAVEAVTQTYGSSYTTNYSTLTYYDVSVGGNCTSGLLDVAGTTPYVGGSNQISYTITTAAANEAIVTTVFGDSANLSSTTPPTGFTAGTILANYSDTAYEVVSSIQSGVVLTWTGTYGQDMLVVSLEQASAAPPCTPEISLLVVGKCG